MKKVKRNSIIIGVVGLLLILTGVTYSFFNYTKTGLANNFSVGDIYFNTSQNGNINLTNVFPITSTELSTDIGNHDSVTISITGNTDSSKGMEYLVSFSDVHNTVNNKKIPLVFNAEITGVGTTSNDYYGSHGGNTSIYELTEDGIVQPDKYILVGYIAPGASGINGSVTITAYIDADKIAITDTPEANPDWTSGKVVVSTSEWSSLKGANALSFKVKVEANLGTWVIEESTPGSCFTTSGPRPEYVIKEMTGDRLTTCTNYFTNGGFSITGGYENFCLGTAKYYNDTFQEVILYDRFDDYLLGQLLNLDIIEQAGYKTTIKDYDSTCGRDVTIPRYLETSYKTYEFNDEITSSNIALCSDYITNDMGWSVNTNDGETMEAFCDGTGTMYGQTFQEQLDYGNFDSSNLSFFVANNIVFETNHVIPNTKVVELKGEYNEYYEADTGAFQNKNLTSVKIPDTLLQIGSYSFANNHLTQVTIPSTVGLVYESAYRDNDITDVVISDGIGYLYSGLFRDNPVENVTIQGNAKWIHPDGMFDSNEDINTLTISVQQFNGESVNQCTRNYAVVGLQNIQNLVLTDNVTSIGGCAFVNLKISNISFGNNVSSIGYRAFYNGVLTTVNLPNSVTTIGRDAFNENNISSVTIGNGITTIESSAFERSISQNGNAESITIDKSCSVIKNMTSYPWMSPSVKTGVTVYGSNNEVCDSW